MAGFGTFAAVAIAIAFGYAYATNMLSRFGLPCSPPFCLGQNTANDLYQQAQGQTQTGGCSLTAFVDKGNSPGWYTAGANSSGGAGWGGKAGHHHCDWKSPCCFCTDVKKCIASGTPPFAKGQCRPDWGTSSYLGGGPYPAKADFSACPAGTGP